MNTNEYVNLLQSRIKRYFDIKTPQGKPDFTFIAEMNAADEGYFLLPSIKTYSVKHDEYLFVKAFDATPSLYELTVFTDALRVRMQELKTTTEHMSSLFMLVFISEQGFDAESVSKLQDYKYHKDYLFTLKGWSDLGIVLVDLKHGAVYCNKVGQKSQSMFTLESNC